MMSPRVLIVYGSNYGQTARIATRIRHLLTERGFVVTLRRSDELPRNFQPVGYDGILVGASMILQGYQKSIRRFIQAHATLLNVLPSGFFAVSGSAGSPHPLERVEAQQRMHAFCASTGWTPAISASMAGAIMYTKYNVFLRWVMKRISAKEGGSTDTSRDHEYTDWKQVAEFAGQFADLVGRPAQPQPEPERAAHAREPVGAGASGLHSEAGGRLSTPDFVNALGTIR